MKVKKKLKWSSIPIEDEVIEACYKQHAKNTGIQSEYISKRALVNYILVQFAKEVKLGK